jgi:hypothetical protein
LMGKEQNDLPDTNTSLFIVSYFLL